MGETRFINDYRGIAPQANLRFQIYHSMHTGERCIGIFARHLIQKGDELLADYGRRYWSKSNASCSADDQAGDQADGQADDQADDSNADGDVVTLDLLGNDDT